jgi:hypothetical protein
MPLTGICAQEPVWDSPEFCWSDNERSNIQPEPAHLEPTAPIPDSNGYRYPRADIYDVKEHHGYRSNYIYLCEYSPATCPDVRERVLRIKTPPHMTPTFKDNTFHFLPVPGMTHMVTGIPFVQWIGDLNHIITVGCVHTLDSVKCLYPTLHPTLLDLAVTLRAYVWGRPATSDQEAIPPFVSFGLNKNMRSTTEGLDGSYSLGITVIEESRGIVAPAVQPPLANQSRRQILTLLAKMYLLLIPLVMSRVELELLKFNHEDNNIPGFGAWGGAVSSCQLNLSSAKFKDLEAMIGSAQGGWHKDKRDNKERMTMVTLLLRLPPGKKV